MWLLLNLLTAAPAAQIEPDAVVVTAEMNRLRDELGSLSRRNFWTGVSRTYDEMAALSPDELVGSDHLGAAEAAATMGDAGRAVACLRRALATGDRVPGARGWLADFARRYGRVEFDGRSLTAVDAPFAPDAAAAVAFAAEQMRRTGSFDGLLPAGEYRVDGRTLVVRSARDR